MEFAWVVCLTGFIAELLGAMKFEEFCLESSFVKFSAARLAVARSVFGDASPAFAAEFCSIGFIKFARAVWLVGAEFVEVEFCALKSRFKFLAFKFCAQEFKEASQVRLCFKFSAAEFSGMGFSAAKFFSEKASKSSSRSSFDEIARSARFVAHDSATKAQHRV